MSLYVEGRSIKQAVFELPPLDIYLGNIKDLILLNQQWAFNKVQSPKVTLTPFIADAIHLGLAPLNGKAKQMWLNARLLNSISDGNFKTEEIEIRVVIAPGKPDIEDVYSFATRYLAGVQLILETIREKAPAEFIAGWTGPTPKLVFGKLSGDPIAPDLPSIAIQQGALPRLIFNLNARATLSRIQPQ